MWKDKVVEREDLEKKKLVTERIFDPIAKWAGTKASYIDTIQVTLIVLKAFGLITISWWATLLPIWIGLLVLAIAMTCVMAEFTWKMKKTK
jgi:hypothetical protein